ncbi:MAG TPA: alpha/beta family hydrolase [Burkholderiales bacterium]
MKAGADLLVPSGAQGVVLFAHGSGSSRHSPRNKYVAAQLRVARLATVLIDLLTPQEDEVYRTRFDIDLLSERLAEAARSLAREPQTKGLPVGLFGASTGAAAALEVAAAMPEAIRAVVSRGGRPDLASRAALRKVRAPTLLVVGGDDTGVIELNEQAYAELGGEKKLEIVPGATHLFEEPGKLEAVARLAAQWFTRHLAGATANPKGATR